MSGLDESILGILNNKKNIKKTINRRNYPIFFAERICQTHAIHIFRVSTKWLNLLRIFSRKFFLRTFALFLRMKRNEFCAQFAQNRKYFLRKLRMKRNFSFGQFFCAICAKPQVLRKMYLFRQIVKNWYSKKLRIIQLKIYSMHKKY